MNLQTYCLSEFVVRRERLSSAEEGDTEPVEQDLHAKVFLFDYRKLHELGSSDRRNATKAAFKRNVEFMLELKGRPQQRDLARYASSLLGNDEAATYSQCSSPPRADWTTKQSKAAARRSAILNTRS